LRYEAFPLPGLARSTPGRRVPVPIPIRYE